MSDETAGTNHWSRIILLVFLILLISLGAYFSHYFETNLFKLFGPQGRSDSLATATFFYAVVNINVLLMFLFLFLTFRNAVKLTIDRKRGVFGSSLRTRLVTSFLFFSMLPTVVLLYISTKFVNAKFETWTPLPSPRAVLETSPSEVFLLSYYVMLGAVTMLIIFSATWLGFTLARELTVPLQVLASATEMVAQGSYSVQIDDIVSQDEIGRLALSFRSMVSDLRESKEKADTAYFEMQKKSVELAEKSEYNSILLHNIHAAVISFTQDGVVESWNSEAQRLFKVTTQEALEKRITDIIPHEFFYNILEPLISEANFFDNKSASSEFSGRLLKTDFELQIFVNNIVTKQRIGTVVIIHDVTALVKAQRLAAWREVARRVAHEIKNPLTPIKLGAQRIERKFKQSLNAVDAADFSESIKVILHSTDMIKRLVDEFIRIAKMPNPIFREADLMEPIRLAIASFKENTDGIGVELEVVAQHEEGFFADPNSVHKNDRLPVIYARFDPDHIMRLFVNLISNAVSASVSFKTRVVVRIEPLPHRKLVLVRVLDWGLGVPDSVKTKIFEPYFSTKRAGTGLGLVIVRQILEEHHGTVTLEANQPQGSIFTVELPLLKVT